MKLDWTVSVWQLVSLCWLVFLFFFSVVRKLDRMLDIFKEFPPHKHVDDTIIFPKGMKPDGD